MDLLHWAFSMALSALILMICGMIWMLFTDVKIRALQTEPSEPEKPPAKAVRVCVQAVHGTRTVLGSRISRNTDGTLMILHNEGLVAVFASGEWISAETIPEGEKDGSTV